MNLIIAVLAGLLLWFGIRSFLRRAPRYGRTFLIRLLVVVLIGVLVWLGLSGRLHWLVVLGGALLPLAQRLLPLLLSLLRVVPLFRQRSQTQRSRGKTSEVKTHWLTMTLDHDSGAIRGEIIAGPWEGQQLDALDIETLRDFYQACQREDPEAIRLLDAYIQRHRMDEWQQHQAGDHQGQEQGQSREMSQDEAWAILGLEPGASREEIIKAYKRMMARVHPDRGGSNYLAARINEAKELLLKQ